MTPHQQIDVAGRFAPTPGENHRILVVDDEAMIRNLCRLALQDLGLDFEEAHNGKEAVHAVQARPFDLVLLDIDMPEMSGWEVCARLRELPDRPNLKILLFSGRIPADELAERLLRGADDFLTKPFSPVQLSARIQAALRLKRAQDRSDRLYHDLLAVNREQEKMLGEQAVEARNALVLGLAKLVACRDDDTGAHLLRLQSLTRRLGQQARRQPALASQLDDNFIDLLACCAPLHDIGKVGLPDHILRKPGKLTDEERRIMQTHTLLGAATLHQVAEQHASAMSFLEMAIDIARHHHERYDGTGYPDRLQGDSIPLAARIVALCDVYDALRSPRPYKAALSHADVARYLAGHAGTHFDPRLVQAFQECAADFGRIYDELSD